MSLKKSDIKHIVMFCDVYAEVLSASLADMRMTDRQKAIVELIHASTTSSAGQEILLETASRSLIAQKYQGYLLNTVTQISIAVKHKLMQVFSSPEYMTSMITLPTDVIEMFRSTPQWGTSTSECVQKFEACSASLRLAVNKGNFAVTTVSVSAVIKWVGEVSKIYNKFVFYDPEQVIRVTKSLVLMFGDLLMMFDQSDTVLWKKRWNEYNRDRFGVGAISFGRDTTEQKLREAEIVEPMKAFLNQPIVMFALLGIYLPFALMYIAPYDQSDDRTDVMSLQRPVAENMLKLFSPGVLSW